MENESLHILRNFSTIMQFLAAIIGSFFLYKYRDSFLKYFPLFLWTTFLVEVSAYLVRKLEITSNNVIIYNIYCVFAFLYLFNLYRISINDKSKKNILKIFSILYIFVLIISGFYENYLTEPQTISYVFAEIMLILGISFYLVEILKSDKALYANKSLLFWISLGLLLFSVGTIPFTIAMSYYLIEHGFNNMFAINYILIIVQNLCFIIGFIRIDKKNKLK